MMSKVLAISDTARGGAGIACARLCNALRAIDSLNVEWLVAAGGKSSPDHSVAMSWPDLLSMILHRMVLRLPVSDALARRCEKLVVERTVAKQARATAPDIVNLHNIHEQMTFSFLKRLPPVPVVWTLHDLWPLTGGCCYPYDCDHYIGGCNDQCPQIETPGEMLVSPHEEWKKRQEFFVKHTGQVALVCPSQWLAGVAKKRLGEAIRVECIPYSLDLNAFVPVTEEKGCLRMILGLPRDKKVILFGADSTMESRKGGSYLKEAINLLRNRMKESFSVVGFGSWMTQAGLPSDWTKLNAIEDDRLLNLYYNAADVFVLPSLADNLPNTLLEATAAGTPCVTFDVGGCAEVVRDGQNGFVAGYKDVEDLASCIERVLLLGEDAARAMKQRCRQIAVQEYYPALQAARYERLFDEMLRRTE